MVVKPFNLHIVTIPSTVAPMDYTAILGLPVNFVVSQTEGCFNVTINTDNVPEMVECFSVDASSEEGRVMVNPDQAQICIIDPRRKCRGVHIHTLT